MLVSVTLTLAFRRAGLGSYSAVGIALGSAVGAWTNLLLLWAFLGRRTGGLVEGESMRRVLRLALAAAAAAGVGLFVRTLLEPRFDTSGFVGRFILFSVVLTVGAVAYFAIAGRPPSRSRASAESNKELESEEGAGGTA